MPLTHLRSADAAARWLTSWVTGALRTDSRLVQPGDAFIAWPGQRSDGRQFVEAALAAGASTCLVEHEGIGAFGFQDARVATLPGLKAATGLIADAFYRHPSQALKVVAVTGTNGKTSSAWWTAQALSLLGQRCGVVGTLGVGEPPRPRAHVAGADNAADAGSIEFTGLTTPDPVVLQAGFRRMADEGFAACAIEASSIGVVEQRLAGTRLEVALFTNFTRDHLDYHGSMEAYWAAKRLVFAWPHLKAAVINVDDPQGGLLVADLAGKGPALWTISARDEARLQAQDVGYTGQGLSFTLVESSARVPVQTRLIGDYNVLNLLGVIGGLRALGVPLADAAAAAAQVTPVPGRMQRVPLPAGAVASPEVVVDYAHTPDALDKAISALRPLAQARGGQLWCVFGCGGDRDATKRPLMGEIAQRLADRVVVTSDNPRGESPEAIIGQIIEGTVEARSLAPVQTEPDRRAAIFQTLAAAAPQDVVLIAGKGHEDYQEINGFKHPFSDAAVATAALQSRSAN
ncbi:UDP-N-acetylmuramoyl-L-alanyl-D-glutamate--2,6-diaminopimelate ligase [Ideonella azotifigens]|uniref:UDP-N-acetylmuramoyl-L-alanyl-D-glutamate--2,6-diaminopimelate ligase n=2 Tax=Ideonella azotifigens TaxID=513160 RepID=A0ABP3VZM3_9BURK|nr:UDP-N-acetylmuramoyl-L-alanyl-D-glutamate--2,6-diaminopimelate ligase [Ideonella azotifigens]MCD2343407.1 UDP-N-acetylmuramoyl-L-alanyl-D-glutamate--2,6-diaminopimelate ligase [Ideonella azotifigens]